MANDISDKLAEQVGGAYRNQQPLRIVAGGSKAFYGNAVSGEALDVREHSGIVEYHPSELVLTARCGTPLAEVNETLRQHNQMLAFEPPMHNEHSTFGGAIASGLSGPRRAFTHAGGAAARDFVLGARIINGKGEVLQFGGQVMKNVAGYDAARLMTGAQGTLGVLLEASVKVLPIAEAEISLALEASETEAQTRLSQWIRQGLPVTASCQFGNTLMLRLSNTEGSVKAARKIIGGEIISNDFWPHLQHQTHDFFSQPNLWRVSVPAATPSINGDKPQLIEWAGALRWIVSEQPLFELAAQHGGHATRYDFNNDGQTDCFQPLNKSMLALHRRIKQSFDPAGILNPDRLYREL